MAQSLLDPGERELLDALLDAVAILDPDLTILYLNASWRRASGLAGPGAGATAAEAEGEFAIGRRYVACSNAALGVGAEDAEIIATGLRGERAERSALMDGPGTTRWLQTRVIPYGDEASRRLLVSKRDVSRDMAQEQSLARYHATLKAVGFAASQFLGDAVWEHSVGRVLQRFGEATDVSRVYVFNARLAPEGEWLCSQLHEWAAAGVDPQIGNPDLQDLPLGAVGCQRWIDLLSADQPVYGRVRDFPEVMPLVGSMDAGRAQQVLETLLEGVGRSQAHVVILDVTGIRRLDAGVADALVRVARAVGLLGAEVVLTRITPEVARTLVELGAELSGIATSMNLQAGMARALRAVRGR